MTAAPIQMQWRYRPGGRVAHAFWPWATGGKVAVCGANAWPEDWRGTGGAAEYERAAALPRCRRCAVRLPGSV